MIKVLRFILFSLVLGVLFGVFFKILTKSSGLGMLLYGPYMMSGIIIASLFGSKDKNDKFSNDIKTFFVNKPVIILSVVTLIFFTFYMLGFITFKGFVSHYQKTKQYDKVIEVSKTIKKIYPKDCDVYEDIAYANSKMGNYLEVMYYNQLYLKCNPKSRDHLWYYFDNESLFSSLSYNKNALKKINDALKINNDSLQLYFIKQNIYFRANDCENGIKDVETILNIIDKKGAERYTYEKNGYVIEEHLPDNWRKKVIENLSRCPNSEEKETLIKKLEIK